MLDEESCESRYTPAVSCAPRRSSADPTSCIRVSRRDWLLVGDTTCTISNLYARALGIPVEARRSVVTKVSQLFKGFPVYSMRAWI
jgi:hypothetical protein